MIPEKRHLLSVGILGTGRAARGLFAALGAAGTPVALIRGRDAAAGKLRADELLSHTLLLLAVPDGAVTSVAAALAPLLSAPDRRPVVLHLAGALDSDALAPLAAAGVAVGSCHPLQTFPSDARAAVSLRGTFFALEGDPEALEAGRALAERLGARPLHVPREGKVLYHLAAALLANGIVALVGTSRDAMAAAGIREADALDALAPLARTALGAALSAGPEAALTGPVARGDRGTLERHRAAIGAWDPPRLALYDALTREQERLAAARERSAR